jgi:hypothetical protein
MGSPGPRSSASCLTLKAVGCLGGRGRVLGPSLRSSTAWSRPPRSDGAGTSRRQGEQRIPSPTIVPNSRVRRRLRRSKLPAVIGSPATTSGAAGPNPLCCQANSVISGIPGPLRCCIANFLIAGKRDGVGALSSKMPTGCLSPRLCEGSKLCPTNSQANPSCSSWRMRG